MVEAFAIFHPNRLLMLNSKPICVEKMPCKDDLAQRANIAALRRSDKVTKLRGLNRLPQQIRVETLMKFQLTKLLRKAEQMCDLTLISERVCGRSRKACYLIVPYNQSNVKMSVHFRRTSRHALHAQNPNSFYG